LLQIGSPAGYFFPAAGRPEASSFALRPLFRRLAWYASGLRW